MPLRNRLTGAFDPETVQVLASAFDLAWHEFADKQAPVRDAPALFAREVLARRIVQMGALGEREQRVLADDAIAHLSHAVPPRR